MKLPAALPAAPRFPSATEGQAREAARVAALKSTGLLDTPPEPAFDRLTRLAARLLGAPVSMISLIDEHRQFFKSVWSCANPHTAPRETPRVHSFCRHVVESREPVVVSDARRNPLVSDSPLIHEMGTVAYLGVPILAGGEHVIGTLCVNDRHPRQWQPEDIRALEDLAEVAMTEILLRLRTREQEKAIVSLRETEGRFRQLSDHIREVFWIATIDPDEVIFISRAYEQIWQRSCESALAHPTSWMEAIVPEDRSKVEAALARNRQGECYQIEYRILRPDGTHCWLRDRGFPIFDDSGAVTRTCGIAEDVTATKAMDESLAAQTEGREQAEKQLRRAQRLESIGTLASGLAHDLNNLLSPILMSASLLRDEKSPAVRHELSSTIERSAERAAGIVKQVLTFARGVEGDRQPLRARDLLREIHRMIGETFPRNITIQCVPGMDLPLIAGDVTQLNQVLMNLCVNARDAMPHGGTLTLLADEFVVDASYASMVHGAVAGSYVRLRVGDTGTGISKSIADKIFDPFFTTKALGKGTGLGLSSALGIVQSHGGFINVHSEADRGSTFEVFLPSLADGAMEVPPVEAAAIRKGRGELILVVDDEDEVRKATAAVLNLHGYRTVMAADGAEALAVFVRRMQEIQVVLTDVMMPVVDGIALFRALRKLKPQVPVIAATGSCGSDRIHDLQTLDFTAVLQKPFGIEPLLLALEKGVAPNGAVSRR